MQRTLRRSAVPVRIGARSPDSGSRAYPVRCPPRPT